MCEYMLVGLVCGILLLKIRVRLFVLLVDVLHALVLCVIELLRRVYVIRLCCEICVCGRLDVFEVLEYGCFRGLNSNLFWGRFVVEIDLYYVMHSLLGLHYVGMS